MFEYNQTNEAQPNIESQTVPNVMIDDSRDYGEPQAEAPVDIGQIKVPIDGTNALPLYTVNPELPQFEIPDTLMRRAFVRKLFSTLLLQNIVILPIIEIFLLCTDDPIDSRVYLSLRFLEFFIYLLMYTFSDFRRYSPVNVICFIVVTLLRASSDGVYATHFQGTGGQMALLGHLTVVVQLLVLIAYSKQTRYKFSNFNAIMLTFAMLIIVTLVLEILSPHYSAAVSISIYASTCYYIYDTQLMLTGHHGYNLNPEEYIFAATNIYADIPNFLWRLLRYFVIDHFIRLYRFLRTCCFSEVC